MEDAYGRAGEAGEAGGLPSAAALSDAVKAANADVEAALRQDRTLQRQRDFDGVVGVFQGVGVRLFAVSVAKLLLLAAIISANASFTIWLMAVVSLPQALAVTCSADLVGAVLVFVLLFGRGQDPQRVQHLLNRRRNLLPGSPLTTALERAIQQTLTPCDNELV